MIRQLLSVHLTAESPRNPRQAPLEVLNRYKVFGDIIAITLLLHKSQNFLIK